MTKSKKQWRKIELVWDGVTDPSNAGWVVNVTEINESGESYPMTYAPAPDYYHTSSDADPETLDELLAATLDWENAEIVA